MVERGDTANVIIDKLSVVMHSSKIEQEQVIKSLKEEYDFSVTSLKAQLAELIQKEKKEKKAEENRVNAELMQAKQQIQLQEAAKAFNKEIEELRAREDNGIPFIELPRPDRLISKFATEVAEVFSDKETFFFEPQTDEIVEIKLVDREEGGEFLGFSAVNPSKFITKSEKHLVPYKITRKKNPETDEWVEIKVENSMTKDLSTTLLASDILREMLPKINRILNFPLPIIRGDEFFFPKPGYDERLKSWLPKSAPQLTDLEMPLDEAKQIIDYILQEFPFETPADKTNAVAGLLTPFLRGMYSAFNVRTPVFFYLANRERAGKDFLASLTCILYEGQYLEDSPISVGNDRFSNSNDELKKKILSAFIHGRKRLHFANNKGFLNNSVFEGITTARQHSDRVLGQSKLLNFDNELEFSLSGNMGVTFTADLINRCRFVKLFLAMENANSRRFKNPGLQDWVLKNRGKILSAMYTLVREWRKNGSPEGSQPFASFSEWASICGGIMENAGYDNPCIIEEKMSMVSAIDYETDNMKALFEYIYSVNADEYMTKQEIMQLIQTQEDIFSSFDLTQKGDQTKFGILIGKFVGRHLSDIVLQVDDINQRPARQKFIFKKIVEQVKL